MSTTVKNTTVKDTTASNCEHNCENTTVRNTTAGTNAVPDKPSRTPEHGRSQRCLLNCGFSEGCSTNGALGQTVQNPSYDKCKQMPR